MIFLEAVLVLLFISEYFQTDLSIENKAMNYETNCSHFLSSLRKQYRKSIQKKKILSF